MIYIVASSLGYGIVFIQNFSLAYFLSINFFGKVTLIISLFSTLYVLFTFGMNAVVARFYFDKTYQGDKRSLISHVVTLWLLLSSLLILILLLLGYIFLVIYHYLPLDYGTEFIVILFAAFLFSFTEIFPNFFVVQEKPLYFAGYLILSRGTIFLLLHAGIYFFGESSFHISLMLLIAGLTLCIIGAFIFRIFPITNLKKEHLKEILLYSFPLMIYALGGIGYSHGYRVIISNWLSYKDLAIFSLSNQIAAVYYLTATSCITGLIPKAYRALEEHQGNPKAIRFYLRALLYIGLGLLLIVLPVSYLFLQYFKAGAFTLGFQILPILLFGQFILFLYGYSYMLCTFYKKTKILTYSMFVGVTTSLLLAKILLSESNLRRVALPISCGLLVQFFLSLVVIKKIALRNKALNTKDTLEY